MCLQVEVIAGTLRLSLIDDGGALVITEMDTADRSGFSLVILIMEMGDKYHYQTL